MTIRHTFKMTPLLERILSRCQQQAECWIWSGCVQWCGTGPSMRAGGKTRCVRQFVAEELGLDTKGMYAVVGCRHPMCVSPHCVELVTRAELQKRSGEAMTLAHKMRLSEQARKQIPRLAKLDEQKAAEIRASDLSTRELAKLYGVTQSAIWCVKKGRTWKPSAANNPFNQLMYA